MIQNFSLVGPPALGFEAWDDDPEYLARWPSTGTWAHGVRPDQDRPSRQGKTSWHRQPPRAWSENALWSDCASVSSATASTACHVEAVEHHARDAAFGFRAFAYELQHRGEHAFSDLFRGPSPAWNLAYVGDSDDLQYLFSFDKLNVSLTKEEDLFVSRIMVDLWTNFAATGNPTPDLSLGFKWTPTEASSLSYLGITSAPP
nr:uncharacterized protein LOC113802318 [Penaeus vannamei]